MNNLLHDYFIQPMKFCGQKLSILFAGLFFSFAAHAYTENELRMANQVYSKNIHDLVFSDFPPHFTANELQTLSKISLRQPWQGFSDPFTFSTNISTGEILIPTLSVKFLDDIAIAIAWFERFDCDKSLVFDTVTAMDMGLIPVGSATRALGIPDKAYTFDTYVDDVSQKTLKSAIAYILLHEIGHVHFQHQGYNNISLAKARQQELQADAFALDIMQRLSIPPFGMVIWFWALAHRNLENADTHQSTHPLSSARLQAISQRLASHPNDFIAAENLETVSASAILAVAKDINKIADGLEDVKMRQYFIFRAQQLDIDTLQKSCEQKS